MTKKKKGKFMGLEAETLQGRESPEALGVRRRARLGIWRGCPRPGHVDGGHSQEFGKPLEYLN